MQGSLRQETTRRPTKMPRFMNFMEYESMEVDQDLQCIRFKNVRLLPPSPLIMEPDNHIDTWLFAIVYYGNVYYDNLALIAHDGAIRRMTVHRPYLTASRPGTDTIGAQQTGQGDHEGLLQPLTPISHPGSP
jgi:hypothetical protein